MKDIFGVEIEVGDWIVYPGRSGSSLWMNKGQVTGVYGGIRLTVKLDYGHETYTSRINRVAIVRKVKSRELA